MHSLLWIYLGIINLLTFFAMFADKSRAIKHQWRIPESTLFLLSFFGGAFGGICGMFLFHHKTKHLSFRLLLPLFFILNVVAVYLLY